MMHFYRKQFLILLAALFISISGFTQTTYYITAPRVFDGNQMHENWAVLIRADKIIAAGPAVEINIPVGATKINYPNATITPGLIEGHSHMLLYPYNIKEWDLQVAKETDAYRTVRATIHAKNTLLAGFTTARDLGSEGAGYADVALKKSIEDNIIIGPPGSGTVTTIKSDQFKLTSSSGAGMLSFNGASGTTSSFDFNSGITAMTISQNAQGNTVSNTVGSAFTIKAQNVLTGSNNTGGTMNIVAGNGNPTGSGVGGDLVLQTGTGATNGSLKLVNVVTGTTAPSAGAAAALPATPAGYVTIYINGTARQLPYY